MFRKIVPVMAAVLLLAGWGCAPKAAEETAAPESENGIEIVDMVVEESEAEGETASAVETEEVDEETLAAEQAEADASVVEYSDEVVE